ncbi:MAG: 50S ribosomal protein L24 [Candidatus Bathyarchaeia archaeon]|nr:50S ribosomal protein L24 [Candidatus Bathyarchaeota archaeon]
MKTISSKPSVQRKILYNAPMHVRRKLLSARLSKELREKYGAKTLPVRKGDVVKIMRGDYAGVEGKVSEVDTKKIRIYVENVTREKTSGSTVKVPIHPSKVMIIGLNLDDKWRVESLEKKKSLKGES